MASVAPAPERKKKESILDLTKFVDKGIRVKFNGGREGSLPFLLTFRIRARL